MEWTPAPDLAIASGSWRATLGSGEAAATPRKSSMIPRALFVAIVVQGLIFSVTLELLLLGGILIVLQKKQAKTRAGG